MQIDSRRDIETGSRRCCDRTAYKKSNDREDGSSIRGGFSTLDLEQPNVLKFFP